MRRHQPFYCEENIWWLAQEPHFVGRDPHALFISNAAGRCLLAHQRAGGDDGRVVWDYHVILIARIEGGSGWEAWDLDSSLPCPEALPAYLRATFPAAVAPALAPRFRVVPAPLFVATFATDRAHMRNPDGSWQQPPPPWPPPGEGPSNLMQWVVMGERESVPAMELTALCARFGVGAPR